MAPSRAPSLPASRRSAIRIAIAVVAVALAVGAVAVTFAARSGKAEVRLGSAVPPLAGTTLDGKPFDLASLRGRPVVLNFWASWCIPCRDEFPLFAERMKTLGPRDNLAIVGVVYKDQDASAQAFLTKFGAIWPSVTDPQGSFASAYRVVAPPQTYFIDRDGVLRGLQIGEVRASDFDTQYAKIAP